MNKIIRLILYSSLLLYCCKGYKVDIVPDNNQPKNKSKRSIDNEENETETKAKKITLTENEKKKFNSLTLALKLVLEKFQNNLNVCRNGNKVKCTNFFDWISKDEQKQKELADAFKNVYDFLNQKRQEKANNEDFDTYISNAIECQVNNNDCNKDNKYGNGTNEIEQFFRGVLNDIGFKNNNEEMFECLKKELLCTDDSNKHFDGLTTNWQ
ncbi:Mlp family lipoprotein [Borrelia hispanica]|uniref:Mlp family lipoprotein n=1 Tax=Borrelia hispanica TaxID=40835 RepID=UPI0004665025|nr:Mlp family lipoprotein [Borrelia hispanica]